MRQSLVFLKPFGGLFVTFGAFIGTVSCGGPTKAAKKMEIRKVYSEVGELTTLVPAGKPNDVQKVIGDDDLTPIEGDGANIPEKYRSLMGAFGRISMGCTATHVGNGIVVTAGHCFEAPEVRTDGVACPFNAVVEWGFRKDHKPDLVSRCVKMLSYELNDDKDYAIFLVDKAPAAKVRFSPKEQRTESTLFGRIVTIFGHPQQRPLEWSKTCEVKPASEGNWGRSEFSHQCDTLPGNSGATVLDDETLEIVGIHGGGIAPWNYGTFVTETPLAEFMKLAEAKATADTTAAGSTVESAVGATADAGVASGNGTVAL